MASILIEVAAFTPKGALTAAENGAGRIELCSGFAEGGLSPSVGSICYVRERLSVPLHVMVRPRVGDFVYDETEIAVIEREIELCRELGADGVVVGILNTRGEVATESLKRFVAAAGKMQVTFHRAFDQCAHPLTELRKLVDCGVRRVLTSGGRPSVPLGMQMLEKLVEAAANDIIVLPGGGISPGNARQIADRLNVKELHLSGKKKVESPLKDMPIGVSLCSPSEVHDFSWYECDGSVIRQVRQLLEDTKQSVND